MSIKTDSKGTHHIRFMFNGIPYKKSAGKGATLKQAQALETQMRQDAVNQANGFKTEKTIAEAIAKWFNEYVYPYKGSRGLSKPETYESHANYVIPFIEGRLLTEAHIVAREMLETMREQGLAASTMRKRFNIIKRPANLAYQDWDWLPEKVSDRFPTIEGGNVKINFLNRTQIDEFAGTCNQDMARDLLYFLAYTGIRWAELTRLTSDSLKSETCSNIKDDALLIEGKGYKDRVIPLHEEQVDFVKKYIPLQVTYSYLRKHVDKARIATGFDITIHDLRHCYGTMLAEAGVPRETIMELMGHTTLEMSRIYTRLSVGHLRIHIPKQNTRPERDNPVRIRPALKVVS